MDCPQYCAKLHICRCKYGTLIAAKKGYRPSVLMAKVGARQLTCTLESGCISIERKAKRSFDHK